MTNHDAILLLGLSSHYTRVQLIKAFRDKAHTLHPDKEGGSQEAFIRVKSAYDLLLLTTTEEVSSPGLKTVCGTPLHELGKGILQGTDCPVCDHKGYTSHAQTKYSDCPHCKGHGAICCDCHGTGKFIQRNTKREVVCKTCNGTGWQIDLYSRIGWRKYQQSMCITCYGSGHGWFEGTELVHTICHKCKGTGEIEMFNPVLQKLAILKGKLK